MSEKSRKARAALAIVNRQFVTHLYNTVQRLQRVTDEVERLRREYIAQVAFGANGGRDILSGESEAFRVSRRANSAVLWALPNMHLEELTWYAARIDRIQRELMCPTCGASIDSFIDGDCPKCNPPIETEERA